ncbi:MAG: hypothetical protein GEU91_18400 [Rhizobiales bacterium]|nr:hypothetical protein [Hyphomicrobiales bacterium]
MAARQQHDGNGYSGLKARVDAIDERDRQQASDNARNIGEVRDQTGKNIAVLQSQINTIGRPNWQVMISGFTAIVIGGGIIGAFTVTPINSSLSRLEAEDKVIMREFVRREIYEEALQNLNKDLQRLRERLNEVHTAAATKDQMAVVARQTEDSAKILGGLYPLDRVLQDIQRRLEAIQLQQVPIMAAPPALPAPRTDPPR